MARPKYRVTELSYINDRLCGPGSGAGPNDEGVMEVEYDGIPGYNLEPLNDEARAAKEAAVGLPGSEKPETEDIAGFGALEATGIQAAGVTTVTPPPAKNDGSDLA